MCVTNELQTHLIVDGRALDSDDLLGAGLGGEHAQNAGSAADIKHDLVLEQVSVLHDAEGRADTSTTTRDKGKRNR